MTTQDYQILIIGGGTGGIMVAAQLMRQNKQLKVAIMEPSEKHYYQPAWTLVGGGAYKFNKTVREEKDFIPRGVSWIKEYAESIDPENQVVISRNGHRYSYEYLVVSPGIQLDLGGIEGLKEGIGKNGLCSNYVDPNYTWKVLQEFKGGNALFTQPATPIKCGGAPQKIMYLADDYWARNKVKDKTNVIFATPGSVIFGVKEFADTLMKVVNRKGIVLKFFHKIYKIDGEAQKAYFKLTVQDDSQCVTINDGSNKIGMELHGEAEVVIPYDMLHLAPPQSAPDFIKASPLAHQDGPSKGWINVDIETLQHNVYANVFALGDAAALPTAKTGAAIRKQAPVVAGNLLHMIDHQKLGDKQYSGYSSCPLVTGYGKMVLAEFKYKNVRDSDQFLSKFIDTSKEQWTMWLLKKYGLPYLYWNRMLKGKM